MDENNLEAPLNALMLGNSFKDEYSFYKYKSQMIPQLQNPKENTLLLLQAYRFYLIDLSYILDINPNDEKTLALYNQIKREYYKLLLYYEDNFNALCNTPIKDFKTYDYILGEIRNV